MAIQLRITEPFIDPVWFRGAGGFAESVVDEQGRVEYQGKRLKFADASTALAPGTAVRVWLFRYFECEPLADYEARLAREREQQAKEDAARREKLNAARDAALALNARLTIGAPWEPAIKDVLSGLSPNSWGDGRSRATVQHIRLLDNLHAGRLNRRKGDFLCTAASGTNGKGWSNEWASTFVDGEGQSYPAPITCKQCLALAEKLAATPPKETGHE